jgi:hypothetical protein
LRLSPTSKAVILAGGSTSANGTGITFPATQSASSDANTLDDYEEGTWTPSGISVITPGYTISSSSGAYTKIGRVVQIQFAIVFSVIGANNSTVIFGGLPFAPVVFFGFGVARDNTTSGAIYMVSNQGSTFVEINSMDGISAGSQRTIRVGESYSGTFIYTA